MGTVIVRDLDDKGLIFVITDSCAVLKGWTESRTKTSPSVYPCLYFTSLVVTWAFCRYSQSRELHLLPGLTVLVLPAASKQTENAVENILMEAKKEIK